MKLANATIPNQQSAAPANSGVTAKASPAGESAKSTAAADANMTIGLSIVAAALLWFLFRKG